MLLTLLSIKPCCDIRSDSSYKIVCRAAEHSTEAIPVHRSIRKWADIPPLHNHDAECVTIHSSV